VAHWFRAKVRQEPQSQNPALRPGYAAHFCLRDDLDLGTAWSGRGVSWQLKAHHSPAASTWKKALLWWVVTAGVLDLHASFNHGPRRCVGAKVTAYRPSLPVLTVYVRYWASWTNPQNSEQGMSEQR